MARYQCSLLIPSPLPRSKDVAETMGLLSLSTGEGDDRYVVVYKRDGELPPELMEAEREAEAAERAVEEAREQHVKAMEHAAEQARRMRSEAELHGHAFRSEGKTSRAKAAAEVALRAVGAETLTQTDVIEKRTVGQIQDDTLAKRSKHT